MRLVLDTQVLIWTLLQPARIAASDLAIVRDRANEVIFSAASIWEIAIKAALRRPDFQVDPWQIAEAARLEFTEQAVTSGIASRVATLPLHHRDPFDRLLVAQAADAGAVLLTADLALAAYAPHVLMLA